MTTTKRLGFIAVLTLLSAVSPRISYAQDIFGSWTGVEEYNVEVFLADGQQVGNYSGSAPATFDISTLEFPNMYMLVAASPPAYSVYGAGLLSPLDAFGPTSAAGSMEAFGGYGGQDGGDFFLTYQSILPDGQIVNGNGSAIADVSSVSIDEFGTQTISFASFQSTVPEPSSIVQAALAVLAATLVLAWRSFRPRLRTRLS
jgi:hypothetical protein